MISVIVPFWNSEQWLGRCCESLAQQDGDFMFLLIDDYSTDKGKEIANRYCKQDRRFRLLPHTHSKGVSGARNTGLDYAVQHSDWITFLDADDELLPGAYQTFMQVIKADKRANMHQLNHMRYYTVIDKLTLKYTNEEGVYSLSDNPVMWFGVWNKLYRAEFVKDIRFDETLQYGEDGLFNLECFAKDNYLHHARKKLTATKHRFDNKQSLSHVKHGPDIIRQVHAYEDFMLRQTDPDIRQAVCDELSRLWGSTFKRVFGEEYERV